MGNKIKWIPASDSVLSDINSEDYPYCLGFNADWPLPKVRIGFYDNIEREFETGAFVWRMIGEPYKEKYDRPNPTHVARGPKWPDPDHDGQTTE